MSNTQTVVLVDGKNVGEGLAPKDALALARSRGGWAWVGLQTSADADVERLGDELGLDRLGVVESRLGQQRSKLGHYGDGLYLVLQPARYDDAAETVVCHQVNVFVTDFLVVTTMVADPVDIGAVRVRLEAEPGLVAAGPYAVLWALCESVTRGYRDVLDGIETDIDQIEEELFGVASGVSHRIFALQREVIDLNHATQPLVNVLDRLAGLVVDKPGISRDAPAFHEVAERARYVEGRVSAFRQTLDNALTIHATLVGQQQNEQMREMTETSLQQNDQVKKISSWAAIGFAPTLVASIYGMNFQFMPELAQPWGYPFALGLMATVSAGLYIVFKKNDWL